MGYTPTRSCPTCGVRRQVKYGADPTCRSCARFDRLQSTDEDALTGGYWFNDHGIQRWIFDEQEAA